MRERPQTLSVTCHYCSWTIQDHAPSERAALGTAKTLRQRLIDHCDREHADQLAGPPPPGEPAAPPPPPPLDLAEELALQLTVCHEALRRIATQNTLTAAKKIAADALAGQAPYPAWNRVRRTPRGQGKG